MSSGAEPQDDFERMLTASRELRARYRVASHEEPSGQVDDALRAAARRAVRARPRSASSPFGSSWRVPLSIAAVVVVSVTVTLMITRDESHLPSADNARRPTAPAAAPAQPPASAPEARTSTVPMSAAPTRSLEADKPHQNADRLKPERKDVAPRSEMEKRKAESYAPAGDATQEESPARALKKEAQPFPASPPGEAPAVQAPAQSAPEAQTPPPASHSDQLRDSATAQSSFRAKGALSERAEERELESKPSANMSGAAQFREQKNQDKLLRQRSAAPSTAEAPRASAASVAPWESDPQAWLRHIEQLVRDNRLAEARENLKAFRLRYPSYPLPTEFPLREP